MKYKEAGRFIELYFDDVPEYKIRETLKICGWKWFGKNKCWSNIKTPENVEFAKSLCQEVNPKVKKEAEVLHFPRHSISADELLVRSNSFFCNLHHNVVDMAGELEVCDKEGNIRVCLIPIAYCEECDTYYVLENTYNEVKKIGIAMCQIIKFKQYMQYGKNMNNTQLWRDYSPLNIMGYCVNSNENLSDNQRKVILENIIDKGILSKEQVLSYIDFFIKTHSNADNAIHKWMSDREYISQYRINSAPRIRIEKIIVIDKVQG